ncbi:hypothetical protein CLV51_104364 [Chitinophaga niastensis]|uniref:Alpha-L-rhamnosidase six-hairpin glycosidase domain-containing protein n=1 Tax=Chitinophaga niastensis TaxID=536980 RepID=A0A2P8HHH5_CHINA|nr:hypothetical protein [Chitinophaga niastensis]PSL45657.1 hypothetical protein CLV51_104364 [Chitinophaga niastensis]
MKKQVYAAYFILAAAVFSTLSVSALENQHHTVIADSSSKRAAAPGIPTLDDIAGDWMPMEQVDNMPAVHNFNHMLVVNRDLTSYFYYPGGLYPWRKGHPITTLTIDGQEYPATETRCFPYKALRRNRYCNGISIETDIRMINESRNVMCRITATNTTILPRRVTLALRVPGKLMADGIGVSNSTQRPGVIAIVRPARKPDGVAVEKDTVVWRWIVELPKGGTTRVEFAAGDEATPQVAQTDAAVTKWAANFNACFDDCKTNWEHRWADAFTPGNKHFSGHLPVLKSNDAALMRNYYVGAWTMLALERTQFPVHQRSFITSGEREDGTQYYWDASMQSTAWALLEPAGMKATLRRWLVQNPRSGKASGYALDLRDVRGFDTNHYDSIGGYAFNACTIFKTIDEYLRVTNDRVFLDEKLENGKTVIAAMDALATDWETLPKGHDGLANYGENNNLLECAPAYINCVPSCNAQNIWMMRQTAKWYILYGNTVRAKELETKAAALLPRVIALYKPGDGVWNAWQLNGKCVELRHCVDFIYTGNALKRDLSATQKSEMISFVKHELLTRDWMRAMSLKDAAAVNSDRPDHGPMGAYDGWIPLTVNTMWNLGDPAGAYAFYCHTAVVTREGPFAQAREFFGPNRTGYDAPVRIAARQGCMKECISGVAFSDVVITTFFGFAPEAGNAAIPAGSATPRPFSGELSNIHFAGKEYTFEAGPKGIKVTKN